MGAVFFATLRADFRHTPNEAGQLDGVAKRALAIAARKEARSLRAFFLALGAMRPKANYLELDASGDSRALSASVLPNLDTSSRW